MADEPEGSPPSRPPGPAAPSPSPREGEPVEASSAPKLATEGARAETGAARTSIDREPESPASTSPANTTPSDKPTPAAPPPGAKPAAAKPAAAKPAAAGEGVTRRGFFSWAAVAWVGFTVAIGGCVSAMGRFMFPNVLFEPPTSFKAGDPKDFPQGVVDTRYVDRYGVWIVNDTGRIYALIAICTHLGCPPAWLDTQNKFKCPCHGSGYYKSGINFEGPTPRPLERARIFISPDDGQIVVDKAQKYQWELGQWEDPNSYIPA